MKTMKPGIFLIFFLIPVNNINAQVSGIAASKLSAFNAETLSPGSFEFEPSFLFGWSARTWDSERKNQLKYENKDSLDLLLESGLRFTYGINSRIEAGCYMPIDFTAISFGSKVKLFVMEKTSLSGLVGFNFPRASEAIARKDHSYDCVPLMATGLSFSYEQSAKLSFDVNAQVQAALKATKEQHKHDYFFAIDAGYYIKPGLQAVGELYYANSLFSETTDNNDLLLLNIGVTVETARNFILVVNSPLPLLGMNSDIQHGIGFAVTMMLN